MKVLGPGDVVITIDDGHGRTHRLPLVDGVIADPEARERVIVCHRVLDPRESVRESRKVLPFRRRA